jgi:NADH-quinone oxidoreductase subunit A
MIHVATLGILLFAVCLLALSGMILVVGNLASPARPSRVKQMPYESGMDPFHDTRRRFDVRFHLLAIAFLVFDVELLFLYPWAVAARPAPTEAFLAAELVKSGTVPAPAAEPQPGIDGAVAAHEVEGRGLVFAGMMVFVALLAAGFAYDWRKGIFRWR